MFLCHTHYPWFGRINRSYQDISLTPPPLSPWQAVKHNSNMDSMFQGSNSCCHDGTYAMFHQCLSSHMCQGLDSLYWGWSSHFFIGIRNPYNRYINPYYWGDDYPLLYGNNGGLDPSTYCWWVRHELDPCLWARLSHISMRQSWRWRCLHHSNLLSCVEAPETYQVCERILFKKISTYTPP